MGLFSKKSPPPSVIDLRDAEPEPPPKPRLEFGFPTPCPACGGPGYLDSIDMKRRVQFEHCSLCLTRWDIAEAELAEANAS